MDLNKDKGINTIEGFKRFFDEAYPGLCIFADSYLGDKAVSADIVQEGFIYIWSKIENIHSESSAKSYLY
jgi:DNA-directed RNA polymerase specialized sigma24 family protein